VTPGKQNRFFEYCLTELGRSGGELSSPMASTLVSLVFSGLDKSNGSFWFCSRSGDRSRFGRPTSSSTWRGKSEMRDALNNAPAVGSPWAGGATARSGGRSSSERSRQRVSVPSRQISGTARKVGRLLALRHLIVVRASSVSSLAISNFAIRGEQCLSATTLVATCRCMRSHARNIEKDNHIFVRRSSRCDIE
jgi:hypothetical protein